jgi:RimJ/RimL family protein N-acetyltransferase
LNAVFIKIMINEKSGVQMNQQSELRLTRYTTEYDSTLNEFTLPEDQEKFTALPTEMIHLSKVDTTRNPVVLLNQNHPVGFFVLQFGDRVKEYTSNKKALLLIALSINSSEQGKGYAKTGMRLLPAFVHQEFPESDEIVLAVNHKNIPAQKLYKKVGFEDTGRRKVGKMGEQFIYNLEVR